MHRARVIHRLPVFAGSIALTALLQTAPVAAQDYVPDPIPAPPPALDADLARNVLFVDDNLITLAPAAGPPGCGDSVAYQLDQPVLAEVTADAMLVSSPANDAVLLGPIGRGARVEVQWLSGSRASVQDLGYGSCEWLDLASLEATGLAPAADGGTPQAQASDIAPGEGPDASGPDGPADLAIDP